MASAASFAFGAPAPRRLGLPLVVAGIGPDLEKVKRMAGPTIRFLGWQPDEDAITLGVNRYPSFRFPATRPDTYSRLRDIEAPMLGACYLTEWTEGLDQLYDLELEIATYRSAEDMVEKLAELGADPARRAVHQNTLSRLEFPVLEQ